MKKNPKKLVLARETVSGLERGVQGGTSHPYCQWTDAIAGCYGGSGDTSNGFYANPEACGSKTNG